MIINYKINTFLFYEFEIQDNFIYILKKNNKI